MFEEVGRKDDYSRQVDIYINRKKSASCVVVYQGTDITDGTVKAPKINWFGGDSEIEYAQFFTHAMDRAMSTARTWNHDTGKPREEVFPQYAQAQPPTSGKGE